MTRMALFAVALIMAVDSAFYDQEQVYFADPNLKRAVEKQLRIRDPNSTDMLRLTDLSADKQGIVDLQGLEHAQNLKIIRLQGNQISDISLLSDLTELEFVDLADNRISIVHNLSKLKKLTWLILYNNEFDDIPAARKQIGLERAVVVMYEGNRDPDMTPPPLPAVIVRADNDYVFNEPYEDKDSKRVKLPEPVWKKMCQVTLKKFLGTFYEGIKPQKYSGLFGTVFCINVPDRQYLHLYVYFINGIGTDSDIICLILYDCHRAKVSPQPHCFSGRWMYGRWPAIPISKPFIDFNDLNLDGNPEVVFKERIHNGTCLNAIVHHFLHIGGDLSLTPIFRLESLSCGYDGRAGYLIRTIEKPEPNQLLVRVSAKPQREGEKKVGYVFLESHNASSLFVWKEKVIYLEDGDSGSWTPDYEKLLLHSWGSPYRSQ
jgi:hypothetical protein